MDPLLTYLLFISFLSVSISEFIRFSEPFEAEGFEKTRKNVQFYTKKNTIKHLLDRLNFQKHNSPGKKNEGHLFWGACRMCKVIFSMKSIHLHIDVFKHSARKSTWNLKRPQTEKEKHRPEPSMYWFQNVSSSGVNLSQDQYPFILKKKCFQQ